jgi:flavodoxin
MERRKFLLAMTAMLATGTELLKAEPQANGRTLIVYYSRRGMNYVGGKIMDLKVGNTEVIAKKIQALTGSDIFQIETVKSYPADYTETTKVAQQEKDANARPVLKSKVSNMNDYNVIYLGYPIWWGTMPMAVYTFLTAYDFAGKTIIPFCTNEGSGLGSSVQDIRRLCPKAKVLGGLEIKGSAVNETASETKVRNWIKSSR